MPMIFYCLRTLPLTAEELSGLIPEASLEIGADPEGDAVHVVHWEEAVAVVHPMQQVDLPRHVAEFCHHIEEIGDAQQLDRDALEPELDRLRQTRQIYGLQLEGPVEDDALHTLVLGLAELLDAYFLDGDAIYNADGELIFGADDDPDPRSNPLLFTIYSARPEGLTGAELRELLPGAEVIEGLEEDPAFAARIHHGGLTLQIQALSRIDEHKAQCRAYVLEATRERPELRSEALFDWVEATEHHYGLMAEPTEDHEALRAVVERLTDHLSGFYYSLGLLFDSRGKQLFRPVESLEDAGFDESFEPTAHQVERYERSRRALDRRGVPMYDGHFYVQDDAAVSLREPAEVARRAVVLLAVAMRARGMELESVLHILETVEGEGLTQDLSASELAFLGEDEPDAELRDEITERFEAIWVLLWALGHVDELSWPAERVDPQQLIGLLEELTDGADFLSQPALRAKGEILDAQDLILRVNWALREAYLNDRRIPANLDWRSPDEMVIAPRCAALAVVEQRHLALNWLLRFGDADWDDVKTPT